MSERTGKNPLQEFLARIAKGFADVGHGAMTDMRQKVVEEGWFGRAVTPEQRDRAGWDALCDRFTKERGYQPERAQERDHDLDP